MIIDKNTYRIKSLVITGTIDSLQTVYFIDLDDYDRDRKVPSPLNKPTVKPIQVIDKGVRVTNTTNEKFDIYVSAFGESIEPIFCDLIIMEKN